VQRTAPGNNPVYLGDNELLNRFVQNDRVLAQQDALTHERLDDRLN
jgi:hypothetical protein